MSAETQCFWCEPTGMVSLSLRRYRSGDKCSGPFGYHVALTPIGEAPVIMSEQHKGCIESRPEVFAHDDTRWPTHCTACGEAFRADDAWQVFQDQVYRRTDTGATFTLRDAPPGAMWDATWWPDPGPDGIQLMVRLPDGHDWFVDGPANNNPAPRGWTRSGSVPRITATPSILTKQWHGFLTDGVLRSC